MRRAAPAWSKRPLGSAPAPQGAPGGSGQRRQALRERNPASRERNPPSLAGFQPPPRGAQASRLQSHPFHRVIFLSFRRRLLRRSQAEPRLRRGQGGGCRRGPGAQAAQAQLAADDGRTAGGRGGRGGLAWPQALVTLPLHCRYRWASPATGPRYIAVTLPLQVGQPGHRPSGFALTSTYCTLYCPLA